MKNSPEIYGKHSHPCPICGRRIEWALLYCTGCSWRNVPWPNQSWLCNDTPPHERSGAV